MATIYVDSAAAGTNAGTSWTNAYTSITSTTGAAAGDQIFVDDGHSETGTLGTLNWSNGTAANPVVILCVDKADDSLSSGAAITNNSGALTFTGHIVTQGGITFTQSASAGWSIGAGTDVTQRYRGATFAVNSSTNLTVPSGTRAVVLMYDCTITFSSNGSAGSAIAPNTGNIFIMYGGSVVCRGSGTTTLFNCGAGEVRVEGVSMSGTATNICTATQGRFTARRCALPTFTNLVSASQTSPEQGQAFAVLEACKTGTLTDPELGLTWRSDRAGVTKSSLSRYRTGGADDGEQANAHSWEMVSSSSALERVSWLESPPIVRWVNAGSSQTVTLYFASGTTYQDDELWVDLQSPNETAPSSTTAQARCQTSRRAFRGTAADLTTDSGSTWNGTGVGTKQKVAFTISPAVAGPVVARVCLGKASSTVYVDPVLEVS